MARTSARAQRYGDGRGSVAILPFVVAAFFILVAFGWIWMLWSSLWPPLALLFGAMVGAGAVLLARFAGAAAANARDEENERPISSWLVAVGLSLALLVVSTLGVVTALLFVVGSTSVLAGDVDGAKRDVTRLANVADGKLTDRVFPAKRRKVNGLLANLKYEIENPSGGNSCGVGTNARKVIREIQAVLPDFREVTGSERPRACGSPELSAIFEGYKQMALELLDNDPAFIESGAQGRTAALAKITSDLSAAERDLERVGIGLSRHGENAAAIGVAEVQRVLVQADDRYVASYGRLSQLASDLPEDLPRRLDIKASLQLASYAGTPATLWARRYDPMMAIYLAIAITLDLSLVALFMMASMGRGRRPGRRRDSGEAGGRAQLVEDPAFLWVNRA